MFSAYRWKGVNTKSYISIDFRPLSETYRAFSLSLPEEEVRELFNELTYLFSSNDSDTNND